jgi:hypothetical protein
MVEEQTDQDRGSNMNFSQGARLVAGAILLGAGILFLIVGVYTVFLAKDVLTHIEDISLMLLGVVMIVLSGQVGEPLKPRE